MRLPRDIALQTLNQQDNFHPRFDAVSRLYNYTLVLAHPAQPLMRQRAWHIRQRVDPEALRGAAGLLTGTHDFAALGNPPQGENTVRTVLQSAWHFGTDDYTGAAIGRYTIEANAFLKHMVRRVVGMLVFVGQGRMSVLAFAEALAAKQIPAIALAPPQGLVLAHVTYQQPTHDDLRPLEDGGTDDDE